jgi:hypothetical protein
MEKSNKTDWDAYYSKPYKVASVSRKFTGAHIKKMIVNHVNLATTHHIAELGGGNSVFYELINQTINPDKYYLLD